MSYDDKFSIETSADDQCGGTTIFMRNLAINQIVAKFEGHSQKITHL
jgi:hypothetical protein